MQLVVVRYSLFEITKALKRIAKIAIRSSFSNLVSQFFGNTKTYLMTIYGYFEISGLENVTHCLDWNTYSLAQACFPAFSQHYTMTQVEICYGFSQKCFRRSKVLTSQLRFLFK